MSWSASFNSVAALDRDEPTFLSPSDMSVWSPESREQYHAARQQAKALIQTGAAGDPSKMDFSIGIGGHANHEHRPANGYGNDFITVSVNQKSPEPVPTSAVAEPPLTGDEQSPPLRVE